MEAQPGSREGGRDRQIGVRSDHHHIKEGDHVWGCTPMTSAVENGGAFLATGNEPGTVTHVIGKADACQPILLHLERRRPELQKDVANHSLVACDIKDLPKSSSVFREEFAAAIRNGATSIRVLGDVTALTRRDKEGYP